MKKQATNRNLINGQKPEFGNLEQIAILQAEQAERQAKKEWDEMPQDEKWFCAFLNVGCTMGMIQSKVKELEQFFGGRSPIDVMVDKSTGYDRGKLKGFLLWIKDAYEVLIDNFKIMEDDREDLYKDLLKKVNLALKTEYKGVKAAKV